VKDSPVPDPSLAKVVKDSTLAILSSVIQVYSSSTIIILSRVKLPGFILQNMVHHWKKNN
jgi:hypothetical protein